MLVEKIDQDCECNGTVADLGFLRQRHFRKRPVLSLRNKYRIISKAAGASFLTDNGPLNTALECVIFISKAQRNDGQEIGAPVFLAREFV